MVESVQHSLVLITVLLLPAMLVLMLPELQAGMYSMESKTYCSEQDSEVADGGCQEDRLRLDTGGDWPALGWGGPGAGLLTANSVTT